MARLVLLLSLAACCACFLEKAEICSSKYAEKCVWIDEYVRTNKMPLHGSAPVIKPSVIFCYQGFATNSLPLLSHSWQGLQLSIEAASSKYLTLVYSNTSSGVIVDARSTVDYDAPQSVNVSSMSPFNPYRLVCFGVKRVGSGESVDFSLSAKLVFLYHFPVLLFAGLFLLFAAHRLSRNVTLFYGTGVTLGVVASLLILLYIFSKFVPKKNILGLGVLLGGYTVAASFGYWLCNNLLEVVTHHWQYVLGYVAIAALVSFGIIYRMGPVSDTRTFDLIQWSMQIVGVVLMYMASQTPEVGVANVVVALLFYWVPVRYNPVLVTLSLAQAVVYCLFSPLLLPFHCCCRCLWYLNPLNWFSRQPKNRLLTVEEYEEQGKVETDKALKKLRQYYTSKKSTDWGSISQLKDPKRFTEFLSGRDHVSEAERLDHEWIILEDSSDAESAHSEDDNDISTTSSPHVSSFEASPRSSSSRYLSDDSSHSVPSYASYSPRSSPGHTHLSQPRPHTSSTRQSNPYVSSPRKRIAGSSRNY